MIEVKGLTKDFGPIRAVDHVSFSVPHGQIIGFLGPNGAGKSTTMKMITCFIEPTEGTAIVDGKDIIKNSLAVRETLGYLPESAPLYGEMTVGEFLDFIAEMRDMLGQEKNIALDRVKDICFLKDVWEQPIETLSKGYRQRVGFAQALVHNPKVLILDEPTDGLDPNQKHEVRNLIKEMGRDKTIILSTHILEEVDSICSRVIIIAKGKLVADASPETLKEKSKHHNAVLVSMDSQDSVDGVMNYIKKLHDVENVELIKAEEKMIRVFPKHGKMISQTLSNAAKDQKWNLKEFHLEKGRLDDVFRQITLNNHR